MRKVLIFGGSGKIGRHLIRRLTKKNHLVTVVTRNLHKKGAILKMVTVEVGEVAACNVDSDSMPELEQVGRKVDRDRVFIGPVRLDERGFNERFAIPCPHDAVAKLLGKTIRPNIHQPHNEAGIRS